jgi:RNA polymerase primary sigma factor
VAAPKAVVAKAAKPLPAQAVKPVAAKPLKPAPATAVKPIPAKAGKPTPAGVAKPGAKPAAAATPAGSAAAPGKKPTPGEIAARIAGKRAEDATRKGRNGRQAEIAPRVLTPADVEARKRRLKTLIVLGKERGFLTFAEINDHLPDDVLDAEQIEGIISMIGDMGIQVYDEAPDAETLLMSETAPAAPTDDVEEAAEAAVSTLDSEFGRTTDPVRMYMREMGSVELLTREGEIVIAKRIEEGLKHMIMAISACPMTVAQILLLADKIARDEIKIDRGDQRRQRSGRGRGRCRRDRRREPGAAEGGRARAFRDDPQALRAHARRADQGRPQGSEVPRAAEEDLGGADADPLLGAPGRAAVRHGAHRGRQHPPDRAQDPGPRRAQGRHAAS